MARWMRAAAIVGLGLASPGALTAQTAHLVHPRTQCPAGCPGQLLLIDSDKPAVLSSTPIPAASSTQDEYVTPDGRFVVWLEPGNTGLGRPPRVALHDVVARTTAVLTAPPETTRIAGNPARPEIYLTDGGGPIVWSLAGGRRLASPSCIRTWPEGTSGDGRRALFRCDNDGADPDELFVVDVDSGEIAGTLGNGFLPALNHDGEVLYVVQFDGGTRLRRYAVSSGALLGDAAVPPDPFGFASFVSLHVDHRRDRVLLLGRAVDVFAGASLQVITTVGPWSNENTGVRWSHLDESGARLYVTSRSSIEGTELHTHYVIDAVSLTPTLAVPVFGGPVGRFVGASRPLPATALSATVQGTQVQLSWTAPASPPAVNRFVLEAGSAPGLANLVPSLDVGAQTSLSVGGVPPGTYYVRVRAGNYAGLGAPSNEVIVTVP